MALYKTRGIVLGSKPFEETAKLITFFTLDHGKIRVIAKGAKRLSSRFMGRLETLSLLELLIASGRNLDILSQCEVSEGFSKLKKGPETLRQALYFVRVIDKATLDRQKNVELFKLLALSLKKLEDGVRSLEVEKYFEVNFLRAEGLFRTEDPPDVLIGEHLGVDIREWKI